MCSPPPPPPPRALSTLPSRAASAASAPRTLSHGEIPLLLHSPLRRPPPRGRVTQIPAWAAAGRGRPPPGPGSASFRRPRPGIRRAAHSHGSWEGPSGLGCGRLPRVPLPEGGGGRERGWRAGGRGRRLGPALPLPSEPGRFAIKKKFFLTCNVPNIVFQSEHPAKSNTPLGY